MTRCTHDHLFCENRWRTEARACCGVCSHSPTGEQGRHHPKHCRWVDGQRVLLTHLKSCNSSSCDGCEPCEKRHCTMPRCSRHLKRDEPSRCARCVGQVRDNLQRIAELCLVAPLVLTEGGTSSAVAVLVGPVPEYSTYAARRAWATGGGVCRCGPTCPDLQPLPHGPACKDWADCSHHVCRRVTGRSCCPGVLEWLDDDSHADPRHPRWVLGAWDWLAGTSLGQRRRNRVTVASAVSYLNANLTDLARSDDFAFEDLAREVAETMEHVEKVMHVARYTETGAPCPECDRAGRKAKPLERQYDPEDLTGEHDVWVCPTCDNIWTVDQYDKYVQREFLTRAKRLTAAQIHAQYGVRPGTLRRWAVRNDDGSSTVKKYGKNQHGQQLYDVDDVLAARDRKDQPA